MHTMARWACKGAVQKECRIAKRILHRGKAGVGGCAPGLKPGGKDADMGKRKVHFGFC